MSASAGKVIISERISSVKYSEEVLKKLYEKGIFESA